MGLLPPRPSRSEVRSVIPTAVSLERTAAASPRLPSPFAATLPAGLGIGATGGAAPSATSSGLSPTSPASITIDTSFEGISLAQSLFVPPDVQVAAGPDRVVEMVNANVSVWAKDGTLVRSQPLTSIFSASSSEYLSDPKIRFDPLSGRWFASIVVVASIPTRIELAVSASSDPTGTWTVYTLIPSKTCPDQPLLGFGSDKVAVSAEIWGGGCAKPLGVQTWIFNKTELLSGASAVFVQTAIDGSVFELEPATSLSDTSALYLLGVDSAVFGEVHLYTVTGTPPSVQIASQPFAIRPTQFAPSAPQKGTSLLLDTGTDVIQDAVWKRGILWAGSDIGCRPPGDTSDRACIRLLEFDTETGTLVQDFDIADVGRYYFYPALRVDLFDNLLLTFGFSSANDYAGMLVTSRMATDSPNATRAPAIIRAGDGPYTIGCSFGRCRYGDYFGAGLDPIDPDRVWLAGEYAQVGGWGTFIVNAHIEPSLVRVTTNPAVPGKIIVDGVPRDEWGLAWMKIAPGTHTVSFGGLNGYGTPAPQTVTTTAGATTTVQGNYATLGFLRVVTNPAVSSTISVNGVPRDEWGMWTALAPGTYMVHFGLVAGYDPPVDQPATVTAGATTTITGNFAANPSAPGPDQTTYGLLRVTTSPPTGAQILIDGIPRDDWGLVWLKLPPGTYTVSFSQTYGVTPPAPKTVTVTAGATTTWDAPFVVHGSLRVTTSPALPATIFVNGVPRDDWGMWQSMPPGTYNVSFGPVPGYVTAAPKRVTVVAGSLTSVVGQYAVVASAGPAVLTNPVSSGLSLTPAAFPAGALSANAATARPLDDRLRSESAIATHRGEVTFACFAPPSARGSG